MVPIDPQTAEQVRALVGAYVECVDRGRFEELAELFAADGILDVRGPGPDSGVHEGRRAIVDRMRQTARSLKAATALPLIRHHVSSLRLRPLDGGGIRADSYFLAIGERGPDHWGRYADELIESGGLWCLGRRVVTLEGFTAGGWIDAARRETAKDSATERETAP